jgi:hypothetical protein
MESDRSTEGATIAGSILMFFSEKKAAQLLNSISQLLEAPNLTFVQFTVCQIWIKNVDSFRSKSTK